MKYTEYGLQITLDELRALLAYAETKRDHNSMEDCIYIRGGDKPTITQYCCYAECSPINHTYNAR